MTFLRLWDQIELRFGECLQQTKAANDKSRRPLCLWQRDGGQPDEDQNEQQQQQPANHSYDNAEIARCFTPFSHPGLHPKLNGTGGLH